MVKNTDFPWELLKAECLRLVCTQLVQGSSEELNNYPPGRKDEMIEFLRDVDARNLDAAVKSLESRLPRKTAGSEEASSPGKRKSDRLEEDANHEEGEGTDGYNTRYKGIKRVKVREGTPEPATTPRKVGRPRKSVPSGGGEAEFQAKPKRTPRKSMGEATSTGSVKRGRGRPRKSVPEGEAAVATSAPAAGAETTAGEQTTNDEIKDGESAVKRGRGRPRKSDAGSSSAKPAAPALDANGNPKRGRGRPRKSTTTAEKPPSSKGKQVFDGVLLEKRKSTPKDQGAADPEPAADAGEDEEEDAVLAAVNGNNIEGDGASSLGGSNKENDPNEVFRYTPAEHDVDMDADGDPDGEAEPLPATAAVV